MKPGELPESLQVYLELRKSLDLLLGRHTATLADFVRFVETEDAVNPVTAGLALDWLDAYSAKRKLTNPGAKLSLVRQFLMHVSSAIPGTEVPDIGLLSGYRRPKPFVFTPAEVAAILEAAASSDPTGSFLRVRIPLKVNAVPKGSRTGFRDNPEHRSERSDADSPIVQ